MSADKILPFNAPHEQGWAICINCLHAGVQVIPTQAAPLSQCSQCNRMSTRFASSIEVELIIERGRYKAALGDIARQKLTEELTDEEAEYADIGGGYDECIRTARRALLPPPNALSSKED